MEFSISLHSKEKRKDWIENKMAKAIKMCDKGQI